MSTYKNLKYNHLATSAQGTLADSAVQPNDNISTLTNDSGFQTAAQVNAAINNLIGAAPGTLDTLAEIATAINNDADVYNTLNSAITAKLDASAVSTFGLSLVDDSDAASARSTLGLGDVATTSASDYATAAQGALADSALQSVSESDVTAHEAALSITESQVNGLTAALAAKLDASSVSTFGASLIDDSDAVAARTTLGLGTAATSDTTDFATAAQGTLADSAVQPAAIANMVETTDSIDVLSDVDTTTATPNSGEVLAWNGTNWVPTVPTGLLFDSTIQTSSFTASVNTGYFVDTATSGSVTVTLPASPAVGAEIHVIDAVENAATANITIARNGNRIAGLEEDMTVATDGAAFKLIWTGSATIGWVLMNK